MKAERAAHAEVVGVHHPVLNFDFLALNTDVRDPVLPATVGASGDVQFEMLIEAGQTLFQFVHQPTGKALRFCDGEFAELRSTACDRPAPEGRTADFQPDRVEFVRQSVSVKWLAHLRPAGSAYWWRAIRRRHNVRRDRRQTAFDLP